MFEMQWFGATWGAPVNESCKHVETPQGSCMYCYRVIEQGDQGLRIWSVMKGYLPTHLDCLLRQVSPK